MHTIACPSLIPDNHEGEAFHSLSTLLLLSSRIASLPKDERTIMQACTA